MTIQARIQNPAQLIPGVTQPVLALLKATREGGMPESTLELVHLRASQINGCSYCVDAGVRSARKGGESDDRLFAVAAWREAPYFTDAERAALALAESATQRGVRRRTSPTPSGPRWPLPSRRPGSPTLRTRCRTRSGTRLPVTTTSAGSRR